MGNYFNELHWKIIRANNLLQFIHKVTIEFRFRKSLAQSDKISITFCHFGSVFKTNYAKNLFLFGEKRSSVFVPSISLLMTKIIIHVFLKKFICRYLAWVKRFLLDIAFND